MQAKGRIERAFATAQDRLVKGLRVANVQTLAEANAYLENEFLPWWNQTLTVVPAAGNAHRPLAKEHSLAASLSQIETRRVANDYTMRLANRVYQIARADICAGLRGGIRVEKRLDGTLAVRFRAHYLTVSECAPRPNALPRPRKALPKTKPHRKPSEASQRSLSGIARSGGLPVWKAAQINRTRTQ